MVEQTTPQDTRIAVFAYGICARVAKAAIDEAKEEGIKVGLFRPIVVWPFPAEAVSNFANQVDKIIVAEMNCGQLVLEVERAVKAKAKVSFVGQDDGVLMSPEKILNAIKEK